MRRLNKEYKLDLCDKIALKYGSTNKDNPQVVYISGHCWVIPKCKMNYEYVIGKIEDAIRKDIKLYVIDGINFERKHIFEFDLSTENMEVGDKKFLSFDLYLKQVDENKKSLKSLKEIIAAKMNLLMNDLLSLFDDNDFSVQMKKNK